MPWRISNYTMRQAEVLDRFACCSSSTSFELWAVARADFPRGYLGMGKGVGQWFFLKLAYGAIALV
eukprot:3967507-Amphidinium_carterae.1